MDAEPENDNNVVGTQHTITATTSNANEEVNFDVQGPGDPGNEPSDFECATDVTAPFQCSYTYTSNTPGTDTINVFVDEQGAANDDAFQAGEPNDQVQKNWVAQADVRVDCTPDADTNPEGFTHTITCTMTNAANGQTVSGGQIDGEFLAGSPNDPGGNESGAPADADNICDAGESTAGTCSFTYTGNNPGTDVICFFADEDANNDVDDADCATEEAQGAGAGADDADDADVVTKTWLRQGRLDCTPETDTNPAGTQHEITCNFFDNNGNPITLSEGQLIDFEIISGPNTNQTPNFRDFECSSNDPTPGNTCTRAYQSNGQAGTDVICAWISHDGDDDQYLPAGAPEDGGDCDDEAPGTEDNDETDTLIKTWTAVAQPAATQVNAEPETDTNPVSTAPCTSIAPGNGGVNGTGAGCVSHTIGVFSGAANNQATTGTPIRADILPGSPNASQQTAQAEITCAIDNNNQDVTFPAGTPGAGQQETHECTYTSNGQPGTDTIRVFADLNNNQIFDAGEPSDEVQKIWAGAAFSVQLTPEQDTQTAGVCNEFTVRVTDQQGNPVVGQTVDVQQVLQNAGTEPNETRELSFCNPQNATGANPTGGAGGATFGDVQGNNAGQTGGQAGRNTTVNAEVGPTNNNGEVTFGININDVPVGQTATVSVRAWVETDNDDVFEAGEPSDQPSTKTWTAGGQGAVTGLNAEPETATNPNGTQHQVTVTLTGANGPVQGVTPQSIIANNAAGRPQGDVADANAGTSPNAAANQGQFNVYTCTASNAQGVSTCTYTDPTASAPGTDTIVFYVNQAAGGTPGPDAGEPQDAVQKTWTAGPQNLAIDVTCAGSGTNDDQDVGEQGIDNAGTADCANPLSDQDEVFTAVVRNAQNIGQQNIRVDFSFGARTNGNAAGANNSTNDATLNATPGGQVGTSPGGLQTFCLTDATGRCSVTLTNATPQAGDTIEVIGVISGQTIGGPATDGATKQWQTGVVNQGGTITLTPRAATNQVGTPHTVTATVRNQFGQPVQGANVDFQITQGPNAGLSQAGMTDATTDANGVATFTYTSQAVGTDTIVACSETGGTENDTCNAGEPSATATKTWQTGPVQTNAVALDMDADDQAGNPIGNPGGCELTTGGADANRESTAQNTIDPTPGGTLSAGNFHRICAAAFQNGQAANNGRLAGATITFTIQGPGRIYAANANGNCATNAQPAAGTSVTVTADQNGIAYACLYSQQVGRTTVTASSGNPAQTATGTKDWVVNPSTARFIQLCHGDVAGTTCETGQQTNEPGDEHEFTARVTDAQGNPVANVPVQFRETGPGIFTPQGGSSATVNTDANGLAAVLLTSAVEGTSTVVAEIDPGNTSARQAGAGNDQCEAPAGTNNNPPAGNCISQTLTKVWDEEEIPPAQCDDGQDNDGDELIDEEDPGCVDNNDNSELPVNEEPTKVRHDRRISIRFTDGTGARNNGLVVFGRVRLGPEGTNEDCFRQVPVNVQRRINGRWVTKKTTTTNRRGRYAVEIFDQASRYRAVAPRHEILQEDLNELHVCLKAVKVKRHRHR